MNNYLQQNQIINNINTDNALASILDNLSPDYILHIVEDSINMKFRPYSTAMPNIPYSLEQNFKLQLEANPSSFEVIQATRENTYLEIIRILCYRYDLEYHPSQDTYADAFYLYQFLVSDFTSSLVQFFVNYIMKEKKHLYENLHLQDVKRNKDSATSYSKKIYSNPMIAIIHANIIPVIRDICTYDISLNNVLECRFTGTDAITGNHIASIVTDTTGRFFDHFREYFNDEHLADSTNAIKLALQSVTGDYIGNKI